MKKFSFRLEKVLSLRAFKEKEAKVELGRAVAEVESIQQQLEQVARERFEQNKARSGNSNIHDLQIIEHYINRLDLRKEELLEELVQAQLIVEEKRRILNEAMKETKVLSKLKEKKQAVHRKEVLLDAEKTLDDIANRQL